MPSSLLNKSLVIVADKSGLGLPATAAGEQPRARLVVVGRGLLAGDTQPAKFLYSVMTSKR